MVLSFGDDYVKGHIGSFKNGLDRASKDVYSIAWSTFGVDQDQEPFHHLQPGGSWHLSLFHKDLTLECILPFHSCKTDTCFNVYCW